MGTSSHQYFRSLILTGFKIGWYFLLLNIAPLHSQIIALTLSGRVVDAQDGSPVAFAGVYIPETAFFAETDTLGEFRLFLPQKEYYILKVNRLGFAPFEKKIKWKEIQSGRSVEIELSRIINREVEVIAGKEDGESGVRENAESFSMLPTVSGNLESVLPSIALGLRSSAGGELSSQYSVRGGSYDENLVFVNDFEIFRPQLIRNGQQEGLSFPNPDLIKDLKFYSGGFETRYGDKMSSVMDIRYKNPDSLKASASASLLGLSFHVEGSSEIFRNKSGVRRISYLVGARYKTTRYILSSLDVKGEYTPDFFDVQGFVNFDVSRQWKLSWIGNINRSHFKLIPESSSVAKGSFFQILNLNTEYEGSEDDFFEQNMTGLSLSYISDRSRFPFFMKWKSALYYGYEAERFDILSYYRLVEVEAGNQDEEGKEVKLWGVGTQHLYARNRLETLVQHYEWRGAVDFTSSSSRTGHFVQWGTWYRHERLDDRINEWERLDSAGYTLPLSDSGLQVFNVYKSANNVKNDKWACWLQDEIKWKVSSAQIVKVNAGIRLHHSGLNQEWLVNPRIKLEWIPVRSQRNIHVWFASGLYHQPPFYREMRTVEGSLNTELKAQKSAHYVLGWQQEFWMRRLSPSRFKWISEVYYKNLWDVVSYDLENVRIRYSGANDAEAYAIGWDNRIHGEFVPGAESWVNLSFLRTHERLLGVQHRERSLDNPEGKEIDDVPRPTDQFMALSIFFQDYLPQNKNFKMQIQINLASGLPYGLKGANTVYRNDQNLKAYHRVDIGFSMLLWDRTKRQQKPNSIFKFCRQAWISAEVFNLLKVKNEASISWIRTLYNYQFAIPNYLSSQRLNLRLRVDF